MKHGIIAFISVVLFSLGCSDKFDTSEGDFCDNCRYIKPLKANVKIGLSKVNDSAHVKIYRDKKEEGYVLLEKTVYDTPFTVQLNTQAEYSATAKYYLSDRTVTVVDGTFIELKKYDNRCDSTCWKIKGNTMNLQLK